MKKLIKLFAIAIVLFMASCSSNTPSGVAEKFLDCINSGKFTEAVDLICFPPEKTPEELDKDKKDIAAFYKDVFDKKSEDEKVKSFKITSEEITEDGTKAIVKYNAVYNNGKEKEETVKLKKNKDGDWGIDMGK